MSYESESGYVSGYVRALEAAGVKVLAFEEFGSYQGDWWARVEGGFVTGSYGSCSGCDAFEAEFGWNSDEAPQEKLAEFGRPYAEDVLTFDQALAKAKENEAWDIEAAEMVAWIEANK